MVYALEAICLLYLGVGNIMCYCASLPNSMFGDVMLIT